MQVNTEAASLINNSNVTYDNEVFEKKYSISSFKADELNRKNSESSEV